MTIGKLHEPGLLANSDDSEEPRVLADVVAELVGRMVEPDANIAAGRPAGHRLVEDLRPLPDETSQRMRPPIAPRIAFEQARVIERDRGRLARFGNALRLQPVVLLGQSVRDGVGWDRNQRTVSLSPSASE